MPYVSSPKLGTAHFAMFLLRFRYASATLPLRFCYAFATLLLRFCYASLWKCLEDCVGTCLGFCRGFCLGLLFVFLELLELTFVKIRKRFFLLKRFAKFF